MIDKIYKWLYIAKPEWRQRLSNNEKPSIKEQKFLSSLIVEELSELQEALIQENRSEVKNAVVDLIWVSVQAAASFGIHFKEIEDEIKAVEQSNFSKYCTTEIEAKQTVEAYREGGHPNKLHEKIETYYLERDGSFVIFRKSDHKILKSINFKE